MILVRQILMLCFASILLLACGKTSDSAAGIPTSTLAGPTQDTENVALPGVSPVIPTVSSSVAEKCLGYELLVAKEGVFHLLCIEQEQIYTEQALRQPSSDGVPTSNGRYVVLTGKEQLSLYDILNEEEVVLQEMLPTREILWVTWSPNSEYIAYSQYSSDTNPKRQVFIEHLPGRIVSRQSISSISLGYTDTDHFLYPTWSPDGTQIAFWDSNLLELYVAEIACDTAHECSVQGSPELITLGEDLIVTNPISWSPTSTELVTTCDNRITGHTMICIFETSDNLISQFDVTSLGIDLVEGIVWSPDGRFLAFQGKANDSSVLSIYIFDATEFTLYAHIQSELENYQSPIWLPFENQ